MDNISGAFLKGLPLLWVRVLVLVLNVPVIVVSLQARPLTHLSHRAYAQYCPDTAGYGVPGLSLHSPDTVHFTIPPPLLQGSFRVWQASRSKIISVLLEPHMLE